MDNEKKKIGVYQTGEYGAVLFENHLHKALLRNNLADMFEIVHVHAKDIQKETFIDNLAGLAMPGRNKGQEYRDEWGEAGYKNIKTAVRYQGMDVLAVCASSAVQCEEVSWNNRFSPMTNKRVINQNALFPGIAIGAFDNHWGDGYRSISKPDAYHSNILAAKVMPVHYTRELTGNMHGDESYGLYWGGCVFVPDHSRLPLRQIKVLARHNNHVKIPLIITDEQISERKIKPSDFLNPAAAIEFKVGKGKVIFSNIHFEIDNEIFGQIFKSTPQARNNMDVFNDDKKKMLQADSYSTLLIDRFVMNCAKLPKTAQQTQQFAKKELVG